MSDKILFVDDEASALDGYRRILRQDFSLSTALSGEEGLVTLRSTGPYAVVISDMRMPGMNGSEFLAQTRTDQIHVIEAGEFVSVIQADLDECRMRRGIRREDR